MALICAELTAFLHTIVRGRSQGRWSAEIHAFKGPKFTASMAGEQVFCAADDDIRDLAITPFVMALHAVGLRNVCRCAAPDCTHLFVKTCRGEFHSVQCHKRAYARLAREQERRKRAVATLRRQQR